MLFSTRSSILLLFHDSLTTMMTKRPRASTAPAIPTGTHVRVRFGLDTHDATVVEHQQGHLVQVAIHLHSEGNPLLTSYMAEDLEY